MPKPPESRPGSRPAHLVVIGCGAAAERFVLPVLARMPGASKRVFLMDLDGDRAARTAAVWGLEHVGTSLESVPFALDAGFVTTPHASHVPLSLELLERGCHVFVEKPLAESALDAALVVEAAASRDLHLVVNNCRRLFPSYREVRRIISSGELGAVRRVRVEDGSLFAWESASNFYLDPGGHGVFLDRGAHTVDIVCWWLGRRPAVVEAERDGGQGPEAWFRTRLAVGDVRIDLRFSRLFRLENRFEVELERGTLSGDLFDAVGLTVETSAGSRTVRLGEPAQSGDAYARSLVGGFVSAVDSTSPAELSMVRAADVLDSIAVMEEAYRTCRIGPAPWYENDPNLVAWRDGP